jgi:uncharacterized membrane protein
LQLKIRNEFIPLILIVVVLIIIINFLPSNIFRVILALPFLLFFPGYTLVAALFPRKNQLGAIERIALSFGLSIAVVPLIGLVLNYTWGIKLEPILYSISAFVFVVSVIAWLRRRRLPESEKLCIDLQWKLPDWSGSFFSKALFTALVISILVALGTIGYVVASPKVGERYTEFAILGPEGKIDNYPREIVPGETASVLLSITNREYQPTTYMIEIIADGQAAESAGTITLEHEQEWEKEVNFTSTIVGENQKIEFQLFKAGENEPYRSLHLWIDVVERG